MPFRNRCLFVVLPITGPNRTTQGLEYVIEEL
jgi:hypothetical protein